MDLARAVSYSRSPTPAGTLVAFLLITGLLATGCWKSPDRPSPSGEAQNSPSETREQQQVPDGAGRETASPSPDQSAKAGESLSAEAIYQKAQASLVVIRAQGPEGQWLGSGFLSKQGTVVTNEHVVSGASKIQVQSADNRNKYLETAHPVAKHPTADLAILRHSGEEGSTLPLGHFESVAVGQSVFVAGNPKGLEATFSKGMVSGIRSRDGATVLQITAPVSEGSSGGPVLNQAGEVIGVVFAVREGGQNLNFAVPVSRVRETLQDIR